MSERARANNTCRERRWPRWQPAALDALTPASAASDATCPGTDAEHEAARQAGFEAGFEEGRRAGYEQGYHQGHAAGLAAGHTAGECSGHTAGHAAGHAAGYAAGLAEGQTTVRTHAEHLSNLTNELAQSLRALADDIGQDLLALALSLAQHIVGDTLAQHPEAMLAGVRDCLRTALRLESEAAPLCLWLHPDDLALVQTHLADTLREHDWQLLADAALSRGGYRVETAFGTLDATLETRWQQARAHLLGAP